MACDERSEQKKIPTSKKDQHIDSSIDRCVLIVDRITLTHSLEYRRLVGKQNHRRTGDEPN